ncbi:hypothetical protein NDU88_002494 [Pleurodeles waltl]|uniref:Uncharacterized protein n=1 Tax=Pleurodeles waltl TaxID=8319 RepID=A0AAV7TN93_PLEWA|nr:hypothetical protein NDU88_002494 [Pleurodeles waltl]
MTGRVGIGFLLSGIHRANGGCSSTVTRVAGAKKATLTGRKRPKSRENHVPVQCNDMYGGLKEASSGEPRARLKYWAPLGKAEWTGDASRSATLPGRRQRSTSPLSPAPDLEPSQHASATQHR